MAKIEDFLENFCTLKERDERVLLRGEGLESESMKRDVQMLEQVSSLCKDGNSWKWKWKGMV